MCVTQNYALFNFYVAYCYTQLGYLVSCGTRLTYGVSGFCFVITSSSHSIPDIQIEILNFVNRIPEFLRQMSEEAFLLQLQSVLENKLTEPQSLANAARGYWNELSEGRYDFQVEKTQVNVLQGVTKQTLIDFSEKLFGSAFRRVLIVQCSQNRIPSTVGLDSPTFITERTSDISTRYSFFDGVM